MAERRRGYAVLTALGARPAHLRRLVLSEALVVAVGGIATGAFTGWALSRMLVAVLTGVFDPPPDHPTTWPYRGLIWQPSPPSPSSPSASPQPSPPG